MTFSSVSSTSVDGRKYEWICTLLGEAAIQALESDTDLGRFHRLWREAGGVSLHRAFNPSFSGICYISTTSDDPAEYRLVVPHSPARIIPFSTIFPMSRRKRLQLDIMTAKETKAPIYQRIDEYFGPEIQLYNRLLLPVGYGGVVERVYGLARIRKGAVRGNNKNENLMVEAYEA